MLTSEHATYNCPWEKHLLLKLCLLYIKSPFMIDCHWKADIHQKLKSCELNEFDAKYQGTVSPLPQPVKIVASMRRFLSNVTFNCVPLHNFRFFKFLISIIRTPTFKANLCAGNPDIDKLFNNSVDSCTASSSLNTVLIE